MSVSRNITALAAAARSRWGALAVLAWTLAAGLVATLHLTFDRAPIIHVRWAASVDSRARAELRRQFALTGERYDSGTTWEYFLTDSSRKNIRALVLAPVVEDTHYIERLRFRISESAPRGGPYTTTTGRRWVPRALQGAAILFAVLGTAAIAYLAAPVAREVFASAHSYVVARAADPAARSAAYTVVVFGGALLVVWTRYLDELRLGAEMLEPFRVGDWLVSYEVGFVRRGLAGSVILDLTSVLHARPQTVVFWVQVSLYTLFSALLLVLLRGKRFNIWFLAFALSPAGLLFPLYDVAVVGRKDVLFFVVFALYAWWKPRPDRLWANAAAFAIGAATTLVHELFFFFVPYVFLMRMLQSDERLTLRRAAPELCLCAGSMLAMLLVSTVGADMRGEAQCAVLLSRGFREELCDGIMRYPVTTLRGSVDAVIVAIQKFGYLPGYVSGALLAALPLVPLYASIRHRVPTPVLAATGAVCAFTLPTFGFVLDWGRVINIHVTVLVTVIAAFLLEPADTPGSVWGTRRVWQRAAVLVLLLMYVSGWSIRHCCERPLRAGLFASH